MTSQRKLTRRQFDSLLLAAPIAALPAATQAGGTQPTPSARARLQTENADRYGGILRVALPADAVGFDFRVRGQSDNPTRSVGDVIFQPLVRREIDLSFVPELATEWTVSDDTREVTFTLREGVTFHNGDPFTADDVVFTFESMLDPDLTSSIAGQYRNIESVTLDDDFTVTFTLASADAEFIDKIARMGILPKAHLEAVGSDAFNTQPVGTGPFRLVEWVPDTRMVLERHEGHWNPDLPYLDGVEFYPIVEDSVRIASLEAGELDLWQRNVPPEDVERLQADPRFVLTFSPFIYYHYITLNMNIVPAFQQKAVRQAVAYSIDREILTEVIGYGTPGKGPINPVSPYFNADLPYYTYDPQRAADLLAEAGVNPAEVSFTLQTFTYPDYQAIGELSYEMLLAAGFNVELRIDDWSIVRTKCYLPEASCDLNNTATGGVGPDAAMYEAFHSQGADNVHFYANDRVDELLEEGRATTDAERRKAIYDEALAIVLDDSPRIFVNDQDIPVIQWAYVQGFEANPDYSYAQLDRTWIDKAMYDELR